MFLYKLKSYLVGSKQKNIRKTSYMSNLSNASDNSSDWEDVPGLRNGLRDKNKQLQLADSSMKKDELSQSSLDSSGKDALSHLDTLGTETKEDKKEINKANISSTLSSCDKESCLICMERMREIVLIPCSHFLTCPLCTPKLSNCPVCNRKIEKFLKIFWC